MTCNCENKKERLVNIESNLLNIPEIIEKLLENRYVFETQRQKNQDSMKSIEIDLKTQISLMKDGEGKPLFKNQDQRDTELGKSLIMQKDYQDLKDAVSELNAKISANDINLEIQKYKFRASSKLVDLEQVRE